MDIIKKLTGRGKGKWDANSVEAKDFKKWLLANHEAVEAQYGLPKGSLVALSGHESKFDPLAQSWSGATGAFQLITDTARGFGLRVDSEVDERLDPQKAIHAAAKYLQENMKRYNGNITHAIAQWNGGNAAPKFLQKGNNAMDYVSPNGTKGELDGFLTGVRNVAQKYGFTDIVDDITKNAYTAARYTPAPAMVQNTSASVPVQRVTTKSPQEQIQQTLGVNVNVPQFVASTPEKRNPVTTPMPTPISEYGRRVALQDNTRPLPIQANYQYSQINREPLQFNKTVDPKESQQEEPERKQAGPKFGVESLVSMAPHLFRLYQSGGSLIQLSGDGKTVEAIIQGKERIYSRADTKRLMELAKKAKSEDDLFLLGKFFYDATKKQDSRPSEYVDA